MAGKYLENLDDEMAMNFSGLKFRSMYVEQIIGAQTLLFNDMRQAAGVPNSNLLRKDTLNKPRITKDMLYAWMETMIDIMSVYCSSLLTSATNLQEEIDQLKNEKIADQNTVIKLQGQLIEMKSDELTSVQTTVKSELKSWSSVVKNSCSKALAPKKMKAALKCASEEEDRSQNLVIYGLPEKNDEILEKRVLDVLEDIDEKPRIVSCSRMGKTVSDGGPAIKPIKFTLSGSDHVRRVLSKARKLREVEGYDSVYISPDRSAEQRAALRKLVLEVKQKRNLEPGRVHFIRNNKIVSSEKD